MKLFVGDVEVSIGGISTFLFGCLILGFLMGGCLVYYLSSTEIHCLTIHCPQLEEHVW